MKPGRYLRAILLRSVKSLMGVMLVLVLTSCTLGEAVMPGVAPGLPADRSVGIVAPVPVPIPHDLDGREDCLECHAVGAVDAPPIPVEHDQDVALCTTCHAVWLAPPIAAAAPPAIPHEVMGREDCLTCHKLGTADAPRVPDNHDGLTTSICQTCHSVVGEIAGTEEVTAGPEAEAPPIPHGLEGFSACTQCHENGGPGIPVFPDDHLGRSDDLCSACHSPAAEVAVTSTETAEPAPPTEVAGTPTETAEPAPPTEVASTPTETAEPAPPTEVASTPTETAEPTPTAEVVTTPTQAAEPSATAQVAATPTESPPAEGGDLASGEAIYAASCAMCHGPSGEGTTIAPDPLNDAEFLAEHSDGELSEAISEGVGERMPAFPDLNDQEILDLIALLRSWQ